jgi:molybdopterin converting factor small subunit
MQRSNEKMMFTTIRIPTPLRAYTDGKNEIPVDGSTVGEALDRLIEQYPGLRPHLFNGEGQLRAFVNLFLNEDNIKDLQGVETPVRPNDRLMLIPSIAGG